MSDCPGHAKDAAHHPHYGFPGCDDWYYGYECCEFILVCWVCGQVWPCDTKQAHVEERRIAADALRVAE